MCHLMIVEVKVGGGRHGGDEVGSRGERDPGGLTRRIGLQGLPRGGESREGALSALSFPPGRFSLSLFGRLVK